MVLILIFSCYKLMFLFFVKTLILSSGPLHCRDTDKLAREFDVFSKGVIDLSILANEKTNSKENWSLTGLVMHLVRFIIYTNETIETEIHNVSDYWFIIASAAAASLIAFSVEHSCLFLLVSAEPSGDH